MKILSKKFKKVIRWGDSYALLLTPEIKGMGLTDKNHVYVSLVEEKNRKKIIVEKD